ncbi:MAG TPA: hypothetical protein PKV71_01490, partial [Calditrichia bacterium]|nr:hypothetical protein [Calditrichia bacterium]
MAKRSPMWYWIPGLLLVLTAAAFGAELISNYINLPAPLSGGGGDDLGKALPVWSIIPFVGILLSIAVFPLVAG